MYVCLSPYLLAVAPFCSFSRLGNLSLFARKFGSLATETFVSSSSFFLYWFCKFFAPDKSTTGFPMPMSCAALASSIPAADAALRSTSRSRRSPLCSGTELGFSQEKYWLDGLLLAYKESKYR